MALIGKHSGRGVVRAGRASRIPFVPVHVPANVPGVIYQKGDKGDPGPQGPPGSYAFSSNEINLNPSNPIF